MAKDTVSIYIDDSAIRVLSVSGRRPRQWVVEPLDEGLVRDGLILNEAQVATHIRTVWADKSPGSRRVIAGISGINCMYRFLTLPELPEEILPEAVAREASRALGVPLDRLYTSWQVLPGKPGETLVYLAAAARTTVDALIRTLRQANLDPYLMDIAPLALARATAEGNALVADLQPGGLDIVVKMDGVPEVVLAYRFESDLFRIPLVVRGSTYLLSVAVVAGTAFLSAAAVRHRLRRLDLVAVLKTRE